VIRSKTKGGKRKEKNIDIRKAIIDPTSREEGRLKEK